MNVDIELILAHGCTGRPWVDVWTRGTMQGGCVDSWDQAGWMCGLVGPCRVDVWTRGTMQGGCVDSWDHAGWMCGLVGPCRVDV